MQKGYRPLGQALPPLGPLVAQGNYRNTWITYGGIGETYVVVPFFFLSALQVSAAEVVDTICKHAKKGMTPSQIGVTLRDSQGI